ncbi:MAG TPA: hypothetical protein VF594_05810 [Rubricoccaceae bacterium]|jgi:hypothetical protein
MPLSPARNRLFVIGFVALLLSLSALATVMITRGWGNPDLQEDVRRNEAAHDAAMPRLGGVPGDSTRR